MSTTTNYLINLYRSLIIERDELKNTTEENLNDNYQMYTDLYKEYYGLMVECIFLRKELRIVTDVRIIILRYIRKS